MTIPTMNDAARKAIYDIACDMVQLSDLEQGRMSPNECCELVKGHSKALIDLLGKVGK